jgi:hypothetical protein
MAVSAIWKEVLPWMEEGITEEIAGAGAGAGYFPDLLNRSATKSQFTTFQKAAI